MELTFDCSSYYLDGEPAYLNSGEFHYFRVPPEDWRKRLRLMRDAGCKALATYIPWIAHEPEEGRFVFESSDRKLNLEAFLQVAKEEDFLVIARPGPYQYSELRYAGLAAWLCEAHPEILAQNFRGEKMANGVVSYLHPLFLEKTRRWFDQVCPIIAKHTVKNGGPIALTQFDNELAGIHIWKGTLDYHPELTQCGREGGRLARFLEQRFGSIEKLNASYKSNYKNFRDVLPPDPSGSDTLESIRARRHYYYFYRETIAEYSLTLCKWFEEHGIDTPLCHNSGTSNLNMIYAETADALSEPFVLGTDHYYNLNQDMRQNNPTPQHHVREFYSLQQLRLMGNPPTVFELPAGSLSDWPPITPVDALACYYSNLAAGMKGHNYYVFTGGPNPEGIGETCDIYDYNSGIGATGEIRPLYHAQKEFGAFIDQHPWLAQATLHADMRVAVDFEHPSAEHYWKTGSARFSHSDALDFLQKGVLSTALCASWSPGFCNLGADDWTADLDTPLVVVSSIAMSRAKQARIVDFVKRGGQALLLPCIPEFDEELEPCSLLREFLGCSQPRPLQDSVASPRLDLGKAKTIFANMGPPPFVDSLAKDSKPIGIDTLSGECFAFEKRLENGGKIAFCGLRWMHAMSEHIQMLDSMLESLGGAKSVKSSNPNIWTHLHRHGDKAMLFILNLFVSPQTADIAVNVGPNPIHLPDLEAPGMSVIARPL